MLSKLIVENMTCPDKKVVYNFKYFKKIAKKKTAVSLTGLAAVEFFLGAKFGFPLLFKTHEVQITKQLIIPKFLHWKTYLDVTTLYLGHSRIF